MVRPTEHRPGGRSRPHQPRDGQSHSGRICAAERRGRRERRKGGSRLVGRALLAGGSGLGEHQPVDEWRTHLDDSRKSPGRSRRSHRIHAVRGDRSRRVARSQLLRPPASLKRRAADRPIRGILHRDRANCRARRIVRRAHRNRLA